jgi:hypothetical protein
VETGFLGVAVGHRLSAVGQRATMQGCGIGFLQSVRHGTGLSPDIPERTNAEDAKDAEGNWAIQ